MVRARLGLALMVIILVFNGKFQFIIRYESGIFWGAMMDYERAFNDTKFRKDVTSALALASGKTGSFLGDFSLLSETLLGKWNDDIGWWGLAAMTAAEVYGKDAKSPSGVTYLQIASITFNEIWQQWDAHCGGGIYWSRDRKGEKKGYKSAITNAQQIQLGARLYLLTKNETYLKNAKLVYDWFKFSGIRGENGEVYDGIDADNGCKLSMDHNSYIYGILKFNNIRDLYRISRLVF